jgi:hypothetical protein
MLDPNGYLPAMSRFRELGRDKPWAQGCIIAMAASVLAATGCFGFIAASNLSGKLAQWIGMGLGGLFVLGALAVPVGMVWWLVGLVLTLRRTAKADASRPASNAPPPA